VDLATRSADSNTSSGTRTATKRRPHREGDSVKCDEPKEGRWTQMRKHCRSTTRQPTQRHQQEQSNFKDRENQKTDRQTDRRTDGRTDGRTDERRGRRQRLIAQRRSPSFVVRRSPFVVRRLSFVVRSFVGGDNERTNERRRIFLSSTFHRPHTHSLTQSVAVRHCYAHYNNVTHSHDSGFSQLLRQSVVVIRCHSLE